MRQGHDSSRNQAPELAERARRFAVNPGLQANEPKMFSTVDIVRFFSVLFVAICLVPAGAHLFEMLNKLALPPSEYMTVQRIYAGWAFFGIPIYAAILLTFAHTLLAWQQPAARWLSLGSLLALLLTQAIFWIYTYPMNTLTRNWTVTPDDLEAARRQWEYSHAVNAGITFLALVLIIAAVLAHQDGGKS